MTRNTEYKRSGHDSSIRIPLIINGPGFSGGHEVQILTSTVDLMPLLLKAAGQARSGFLPNQSTTPDEIFVQMSELLDRPRSSNARIDLRCRRSRDASASTFRNPTSPRYNAFQLYNNRADPNQLVNLCGRQETVAVDRSSNSANVCSPAWPRPATASRNPATASFRMPKPKSCLSDKARLPGNFNPVAVQFAEQFAAAEPKPASACRVFFPSFSAQYGISVQCAEPVTGSSATPSFGAKKRETKSQFLPFAVAMNVALV